MDWKDWLLVFVTVAVPVLCTIGGYFFQDIRRLWRTRDNDKDYLREHFVSKDDLNPDECVKSEECRFIQGSIHRKMDQLIEGQASLFRLMNTHLGEHKGKERSKS